VSPNPQLSDHLGALTDAASTLVRSEIRLARAEIGEGVRGARRGLIDIAVGLLLLHVALIAALGGAVAGLSLVWPVWQAALAVAGGGVLVAIASVWIGVRRLGGLKPKRTLQEARATIDLFTADPQTPHAEETS